MTVFSSAQELYAVATPFFSELGASELGSKFAAAGDLIRITYSDPDAQFLLDTRHAPPLVVIGDAAAAADPVDIELTMSADDGHRMWIGSLNVKKALAARKVKVAGPLMNLLKLLPALQPTFAEYRDYLARIGRPELLDY